HDEPRASLTLEREEESFEEAVPAKHHAGRLAVDIYEQDDYYIIKALLAGVRMSDLDIEVDDRTVTIRGMRRNPDEIGEDRYYLQECYWGEFSRSVTLPVPVDARKIR